MAEKQSIGDNQSNNIIEESAETSITREDDNQQRDVKNQQNDCDSSSNQSPAIIVQQASQDLPREASLVGMDDVLESFVVSQFNFYA